MELVCRNLLGVSKGMSVCDVWMAGRIIPQSRWSKSILIVMETSGMRVAGLMLCFKIECHYGGRGRKGKKWSVKKLTAAILCETVIY